MAVQDVDLYVNVAHLLAEKANEKGYASPDKYTHRTARHNNTSQKQTQTQTTKNKFRHSKCHQHLTCVRKQLSSVLEQKKNVVSHQQVGAYIRDATKLTEQKRFDEAGSTALLAKTNNNSSTLHTHKQTTRQNPANTQTNKAKKANKPNKHTTRPICPPCLDPEGPG